MMNVELLCRNGIIKPLLLLLLLSLLLLLLLFLLLLSSSLSKGRSRENFLLEKLLLRTDNDLLVSEMN